MIKWFLQPTHPARYTFRLRPFRLARYSSPLLIIVTFIHCLTPRILRALEQVQPRIICSIINWQLSSPRQRLIPIRYSIRAAPDGGRSLRHSVKSNGIQWLPSRPAAERASSDGNHLPRGDQCTSNWPSKTGSGKRWPQGPRFSRDMTPVQGTNICCCQFPIRQYLSGQLRRRPVSPSTASTSSSLQIPQAYPRSRCKARRHCVPAKGRASCPGA